MEEYKPKGFLDRTFDELQAELQGVIEVAGPKKKRTGPKKRCKRKRRAKHKV